MRSTRLIAELKKIWQKKPIRSALIVSVIAGAFVAGWFAKGIQKDDVEKGYEIRQGGYTFINPLLECETGKDTIGDMENRPFKSKLQDLIKGWEASGKVFTISVYFRDLNNGPWMGINFEVQFSPASLLKVPNMIACLKQAENNPQFMRMKVRYPGGSDENIGENYKPSRSLMPGHSYTIEELLARMIIYSDNNANSLLLQHLDPRVIAQTYEDMGVSLPGLERSEDFMTIKSYAAFFRVLFNASYLSREMSEKALSLLSKVEFRDGLVGGVPHGIPVAHKFGERAFGENGSIKQLHDCGIVYYPDSPYFLCVMTRGNSFEYLDDAIRDVSRLVYEEVDQQQREHHRTSP